MPSRVIVACLLYSILLRRILFYLISCCFFSTYSIPVSFGFALKIIAVPIPPPKCLTALGMEKMLIADNHISASSFLNNNHRATHARLHFRIGSWSAKTNDDKQYLQVDFNKVGKKETSLGSLPREGEMWTNG